MQTIIGKQFPQTVIPLIDHAKHSIKIVVFDWRWYPNDPSNPVQLLNQAIVRAIRRGVKVEAVVNSNDIMQVLNDVGIKARRFFSKTIMHAKMMILDDQKVVVGSHNYSQSAFTMNQEISVLLDVPTPAELANFNEFFYNLFNS